MQLFAFLSLLAFPFFIGIAAEDGPPDKVDRSKCKNTPSAQGNFLLKVVIPCLNKVIEFCEWAYHKIQALDPDGSAGTISEEVRLELKEDITEEVMADVREQMRREDATANEEGTAEAGSDPLFDENEPSTEAAAVGTPGDAAETTEDASPPQGSGSDAQMMEDMQALGPLLQELDSRAAENLGEADLADPQALRATTDEELKEIGYVGEKAIEKIREVYPYEGE